MKRESLTESLAQCIRTDIRYRDEESPLNQENSQSSNRESSALEDPKVGIGVSIFQRRETASDENVGNNAEGQAEKANYTATPRKPDLGDQFLEH